MSLRDRKLKRAYDKVPVEIQRNRVPKTKDVDEPYDKDKYPWFKGFMSEESRRELWENDFPPRKRL